MPFQTRIPSQPDLSPSFYSPTSPSRSTVEPVRRNLFSAHLSRRPGPSQSQSDSSQPHSQQPPQLPSQYRNISPFASPPRLTPTTEVPPSFSNNYDPSQSPNRPLSPRTSATLFPANSIIPINPTTGRPIVPRLPTLPPHLTLEDDADEDDEEEVEDIAEQDLIAQQQYLHHHHQQQHPDPFYAPHQDLNAYSSYAAPQEQLPHAHIPHPLGGHYERAPPHPHHSSLPQQQHPYPAELPSPTTAESTAITAMMTRYRARQQQHQQDTQSHPVAHSSASRRSAPPAQQQQPSISPSQATHRHALIEAHDDDDDEDPYAAEEKAALMAHLMAKLRRVVESTEADGWMFGEREIVGVDTGGGGGASGMAAGGIGAAVGNAGVVGGGADD